MKTIFHKILTTTALSLAAGACVSCQKKTMQVDISLSSAGAPLSFTCCSVERGYSHIKRLFDVTGVGSTYTEKPYRLIGAGTLQAPIKKEAPAEVNIYVDPQYYPIDMHVSWVTEAGARFSRALTLNHEDFPAEILIGTDESSPTYFYNFQPLVNGELHIKKLSCDTRLRDNYSRSMMTTEPQSDN